MLNEELFYKCLDRIDKDAKVAEEFLVGCVHELSIRYDDEVSKETIRSNFETIYIDKYERYLKLIYNMKEDSLCSLVASSIDISLLYKQINIIYDKIELSDYDDVTENCHAQKAERAGNKLLEIANKMRPAIKVKTDYSLFSGVE